MCLEMQYIHASKQLNFLVTFHFEIPALKGDVNTLFLGTFPSIPSLSISGMQDYIWYDSGSCIKVLIMYENYGALLMEILSNFVIPF